MTRLAILWDGMQAVRERGVLKWAPLGTEGTTEEREKAPPTVVRCDACRSMKPAGAKHHGAAKVDTSGQPCQHGKLPRYNCVGATVPPPCCWEDA